MEMEILNQIAEKLGGQAWSKGDKVRIYFKKYPSGIENRANVDYIDRTATAYLDFDEMPTEVSLDGSCLYVFSNCYKQGTAWNINRAKQIKHELMRKISKILKIENPCENWQDVIL